MAYDTVALIVAAGRGERAGGDLPKQFVPLSGIPVIARAFDAFRAMPVVIVVGDGQDSLLRMALGNRQPAAVVTGGASRRASVLNGLRAIADAGGARRVLIHDAARPMLPWAVIERLLAKLDDYAGAVPALPVADTLVRHDGIMGDTVARDHLYRVQTPQAFVFDAVMSAHANWPEGEEPTDDAQMVRDTGHAVTIVEGDPMLEKITRPEDFLRAERTLGATMTSRTAMGFDVHRLEAGEALWLCGVRIEHSHGLAGHSDADVALHALTDALLGTIGAGDIGMHFPPSDPQWRGARSDQFLVHARDLIRMEGGRIDHVDVTLICEAPKIGPHREAMRARLGELLELPLRSVSVKATTTERLGFTGRGEGIAAQAIATVAFWRHNG
jgi:2-C-methyl-D-erythritol 4-phosphate cytidylyltransferase/2-C-methyl-D-erythritol 2,4-cyclodiphosphate synthase